MKVSFDARKGVGTALLAGVADSRIMGRSVSPQGDLFLQGQEWLIEEIVDCM